MHVHSSGASQSRAKQATPVHHAPPRHRETRSEHRFTYVYNGCCEPPTIGSASQIYTYTTDIPCPPQIRKFPELWARNQNHTKKQIRILRDKIRNPAAQQQLSAPRKLIRENLERRPNKPPQRWSGVPRSSTRMHTVWTYANAHGLDLGVSFSLK